MLSLPPGIRYVLAWDHALCRAMVGVFMRAVLGFLRRRARERLGVANGRGGAVAIIQRFGSALNLNVHVHALVVDGVYAEDGSGGLCFHPATPPTDEEMDALLGRIARRIDRLLARRGVVEGGDHGPDRWSEEAPVLAGIADASVQGRVAFGPRAGAQVRRCGGSPELMALSRSIRGSCHARQNGFDLHAAVVVPGRDRARLERVCRYALRPPVAHDRICLTERGQVLLALRHRWADGTSHLLFDPVELLERLAALTPRPRINLVLYDGVLGARSAWRSRLGEPATAAHPAPEANDQHFVGIPTWKSNLMTEYRMPAGPATFVMLNWQLVGRRPIDDANTSYTPAYNVVDAGVRYAHPLKGVATTWRLNVNNIGNAHYWSTLGPGNITGTNVGSYTAHLGQPRTVAASMEVAF